MAAGRCAQVAQLVKLAQGVGPASQGDVGVRKHIQRCLKRAPGLQGNDLVDMARGMATLKCKDEKTWQQFGDVVTRKVSEIKVVELVRIAGSFSVASHPNTEMLSAVIGRIKESPVDLSCWSWADFIFTLQSAKMRPDPQLLHAAADVMLTDFSGLKSLKSWHFVAFVDASHNAGVLHAGMLHFLSSALVKRMHCLNALELSRVALAFGQATCRDHPFLHSLSEAVRQKLVAFPPNRISYTLHGLSMLNCKDTELLAELASAWASRGPEEPIQVVHVMSALAKSRALGPSLCNQIAAHSLHCVPSFNTRSLATILRMCSQFGCTHLEFLELAGKAASLKIAEFSAGDLCTVALAGAKLSLAQYLGTCVPIAAVERASEFDGSQLALMMHAVSVLSSNAGRYLPSLENAVLQHVGTLLPADLRSIAAAWTEVSTADTGLMDAVASRTFEVIDRLDSSTIRQMLQAYSALKTTNLDLFKALGARCADTVSSFTNRDLGYTAFAFVRLSVHDEVPLSRIAEEALTRLKSMHPICISLLARAFIQADVDSPAIRTLLEGLAAKGRQGGWTELKTPMLVEQTDFQKQCAETVREFLPSVMVNQRHEMGPLLTMVLEETDGSLVNLEVDPIDLHLSTLDRVVRGRRDEFLESLGVQVLRFKVRDMDDLRYHMKHIFGNPMVPGADDSPAELEDQQLGLLGDQLEAPVLCESSWTEMEMMEPGSLQSQSVM